MNDEKKAFLRKLTKMKAVEMQTVKAELKELAVAYQLALEFDYCPSTDEYDQAVEAYGFFDIAILQKWEGLGPDEITDRIVNRIKVL